MALISGTYTDDQIVKDLLEDFIEQTANYTTTITNLADYARIWTNNAIGLDNDFTSTELDDKKNEAIKLANSHWVAGKYLKQFTDNENLVEHGKDLIATAKELLIIWGRANDVRVAFRPLEIREEEARETPTFTHAVTDKTLSREYTEEDVEGG